MNLSINKLNDESQRKAKNVIRYDNESDDENVVQLSRKS